MIKRICAQCGKSEDEVKFYIYSGRNTHYCAEHYKAAYKKQYPKPLRNYERNAGITCAQAYNVVLAVGNVYGMTVEHILSKTRKGDVPDAKHMAWKIISNTYNVGDRKIGRLFGCKYDHASVYYGIGSIEARIDTEELTKARYTAALDYLQNIEA